MKETDKLTLKNEPALVKNISIGISEENILMVFNKNGEEEPEYTCVLQAEKLKEFIAFLYQSGVAYEKEFHRSIGFNSGNEE